MKVLVATRKTQGKRANDFCRAKEGELVKLGPECAGGSVDDACGCTRSFVGFKTGKATTTFKVVESTLTLEEYSERFAASEARESPIMTTNRKALYDAAGLLLEIASHFPVGAIVERRGGVLQTRSEPYVKYVARGGMPYRKIHEKDAPNTAILRIPITKAQYNALRQRQGLRV